MIESTTSHRTPLLAFGLFTGTLAALFHLLIRSATYTEDSGLLAAAITADLLLTIPLAYLLLARRYRLPYRMVAPLFIAMIFLASWLLPQQDRAVIDAIRMVAVPLVELAAIVFLIFAVRKARHAFRSTASWDSAERIRSATFGITGHRILAAVLASEVAMFHYLFRKPGGAVEAPPESRTCGSHHNSPVLAILAVLSMAVVIETFAVHLLVGRWSMPAAWFFTALSVYSLLFIIAHGRALVLRPHVITDSRLHIRNGLMWSADIRLDRITSVELGEGIGDSRTDVLNAVTLAPGNLTVTVEGGVDCIGMYGIRKHGSAVRFHSDDPAALHSYLTCTKPTLKD